jgi:hypothetical protein
VTIGLLALLTFGGTSDACTTCDGGGYGIGVGGYEGMMYVLHKTEAVMGVWCE